MSLPFLGSPCRLLARGAVLAYHDPYVPGWSVDGEPVRRVVDLKAEISMADLVILLQDHAVFDLELIAEENASCSIPVGALRVPL